MGLKVNCSVGPKHHASRQGGKPIINVLAGLVLCITITLLQPAFEFLFAQSAGEKTGVNSALGISPSTADFVKEVAVSDMFEIEAGKVAQAKAMRSKKLSLRR